MIHYPVLFPLNWFRVHKTRDLKQSARLEDNGEIILSEMAFGRRSIWQNISKN